MTIASIGDWEFFVPDGWALKDNGVGVSYIVSPDGAAGMYVTCIRLNAPKANGRDLADYLHETHKASFEALDGANWRLVDRRDAASNGLHRSALDLLDKGASYRVLSLVVCDSQEAIQITVHDYLCDDYDATRGQFSEIEDSIQRASRIG